MSQTVAATAQLGPGKTGLAIGYRVLNLDGTTYSAFSTAGVAETSVPGTYRKASGVVAPNAGGYIVWGVSGTDYAEAAVDSDVINSVSGSVGGVAGLTAADVAAIKAVTDKVGTMLVLDGAVYQLTANALELAPTGSGSGLDAAGVRAAVGLATANLDTQLADVPTVAEFNARTLAAADYTVVSDLPVAPDNASIAAILVDTGELQTDWHNGGRLDLLLDSAAAGGGLDAAGVRGALGMATANLDTQLAAVAKTGADGDTLETLSDQLDPIGIAGDPWAITLPGDYTSDQAGYFISLLTGIDTSAVTVTSTNNAGVLTFTRGVTFSATVSGLTISATWAKLYFTLKESDYDTDEMSLLQLVVTNPAAALTDGLLYLDGADVASPITHADGTLTVSQAAGTVGIAITDNAMAQLSKASGLVWDIKTKDAAGATVQNATGTASVGRAITQTI